jgi:S-adenosylmethionine:tRNA ribosyltransferase-isomerase
LSLNLSDFDYFLPADRIAQTPAAHRDDSRLLVLDRGTGGIEHRRFRDIGAYLRGGDLLVLNDSRVLPARLRARRPSGGRVEVFLLEATDTVLGTWHALVRPAKAGRRGEVLSLVLRPEVTVQALEATADGFRVLIESGGEALGADRVLTLLEDCGETPLPPYIRRQRLAVESEPGNSEDRERYQTVFAEKPGAVAAPTAGLHFTTELLDALRRQGVRQARITLHVGLGTFKPLGDGALARGELHAERVEVSESCVEEVVATRRGRGRIVAVGTTTARALESFAACGAKPPYRGRTRLFIRPGHRFQLVDALITNFHLPRSSLLVLVSTFAGRETVLRAYAEAIEMGYRFYSFGDAMLIL